MINVLIIEDDPIVKKIWEQFIKKIIYSAEFTSFPSLDHIDFEEANINNWVKQYDLIITDIFLSGDKTGIDFVKAVNSAIQTKIILTSSIQEDNFKTICEENKFSCYYIKKPIEFKKAQLLIEKILNIHTTQYEEKILNFIEKDNLNHQRNVDHDEKPVVLITGCSSGIGAALCDKLIKCGEYRVVITARLRTIKLLQKKYDIYHRDVLILPLDLTDYDEIKNTILIVLQKWGRIDVLINNAGICYRTAVEDMDLESELIQLKTNYLGPMALIRYIIPVMREHGAGKIINVSSVSGIVSMPTMGSYSASKHALEGASESLWYELKPFGLNVSVIRPGFIKSDGYRHTSFSSKAILSEKLLGPYIYFYSFMGTLIEKLMNLSVGTPENIADKIIHIIKSKNPPLWNNVTNDAHLFALLRQIVPPFFFHRLMSFFLFLRFKKSHFYIPSKPVKR